MIRYKRLENETDNELLFRMASNKEVDGSTWQQIADEMNRLTSKEYSESCYRKRFSDFDKMYNSNISNLYEDEVAKEIQIQKEELYKSQVNARDAIREHRSLLRQEARIENLIAAIKEDALGFEPNLMPYQGMNTGIKEAILNIGDWHIGNVTHNFYNNFDLTIAEKRINFLCDEVIKYCNIMKVKTLHLVNLGDLIENSLHVTARVQNEIDAIQQIKIASRFLFLLICKLAQNIEQVTYRSVVDNHSRANIDFRQHLEKESFCELIDWWLEPALIKAQLENPEAFKNPVKIIKDNLDENIGYFMINDYNIFFSHGHIGSANTITQDLTFGTGIIADIVLLGHWHTDKVKNYQGKKVFFNGSLKGTDDYSLNHRLFGYPSQNLMIFDNKNIMNIPIVLD